MTHSMTAMSDTESAQILIVDDARDIREPLGQYLRKSGYRVRLAANVAEARAIIAEAAIHLVLLDIMMPGESGLALLHEISGRDGPPVIMLTARTEEDQVVSGLEMGADDYVTKPFQPRELLARIRAALRRSPPSVPVHSMRRRGFAGRLYDPVARSVTLSDGQVVALTTSESRLLRVLLDHPGQILSRSRLLDAMWNREAKAYDRAIDNSVSRLRRKLADDAKDARLIVTEWGGGYRLALEPDDIS